MRAPWRKPRSPRPTAPHASRLRRWPPRVKPGRRQRNASRARASGASNCCEQLWVNSIASLPGLPRLPVIRVTRGSPSPPMSSASSRPCARSASGSAPSTCAPTRSWMEILESRDRLTAERDDLTEAIKRLRQAHPQPEPGGPRAAPRGVRGGQQALPGPCSRPSSRAAPAELQLVESDDPLEAGLELIARPPGKKPAVAVAAVRRRAGADRRWR